MSNENAEKKLIAVNLEGIVEASQHEHRGMVLAKLNDAIGRAITELTQTYVRDGLQIDDDGNAEVDFTEVIDQLCRLRWNVAKTGQALPAEVERIMAGVQGRTDNWRVSLINKALTGVATHALDQAGCDITADTIRSTIEAIDPSRNWTMKRARSTQSRMKAIGARSFANALANVNWG